MTLLSADQLSLDRALRADAVIAGGGAGGAMAARELARGGLDVILLEEGEDHVAASFDQREDHMLPALFAEMGGRRTEDLAVLVLSGQGLGGSTIHNTNLCKRTAPPILAHWSDELGIEGVGETAMAPYFEEVERLLGVHPIPDARVNAHNRVMRRGIEALGWQGARLSHNRDERCIGSGFCELGCAYDAKLNARRVLIPDALIPDARVVTRARVERVRHDGARVLGVQARVTGEGGQAFTVDAPIVLLAGSAIGSPAIALRSGLPDPHARLGVGLRLHPGAAVAGVFDERLESWRGIPQSWECTEYLDLRPGSERRVWLVPSFAHPVGTAAMMPGFGPTLLRSMGRYAHLAVIAAMVHDEAAGSVRLDGERIRIAYQPTAGDREQLALGSRAAARILFAAGAREVTVPGPRPITQARATEIDTAITADRFVPHDVPLTAVHPMGSLPMGRDPMTSVLDAEGRHHQVRGLYAVDGSIFPTSIGTPPQVSIYAFAMKIARTVLADAQR